jgi:hypothetical protein
MKIYPWAGKICFFYCPSEICCRSVQLWQQIVTKSYNRYDDLYILIGIFSTSSEILRCCDRRWLRGNVRCHGVRDPVQLRAFSTALVKNDSNSGIIFKFILGCNKKSYPQIMSNFRKEEQILINFCNFVFVFYISNQVFPNARCF